MSTTLTARSQRVFPAAIVPGCEILIRKSIDGGWYTDAGSVARGKHDRAWVTVKSVSQSGTWYAIIFTDDAPIACIGPSANSKLIARQVTA